MLCTVYIVLCLIDFCMHVVCCSMCKRDSCSKLVNSGVLIGL